VGSTDEKIDGRKFRDTVLLILISQFFKVFYYFPTQQELYIGKDVCIKTHKRKGKLVDPGDLVSDKSLSRVYKILGKVLWVILQRMMYYSKMAGNLVARSLCSTVW
jgi:hypothetical protein